MKRKFVKIGVLLGMLTLVGLTVFFLNNNGQLSLRIGDEGISEEEYLYTMNTKKNEVTQYFNQKYGAKIDKNFWEANFKGERPYVVLADKTMDALTQRHGVYAIAKEKGYVEDSSFTKLNERFERENKNRELLKEQGKPVYGLAKFTLGLYIEYESDVLQKKYCDDINNEGMRIVEEESKNYYNEQKDNLFRKNDDLELAYVKVYYGVSDLTKEEVQALKDHLLQASKAVNEGTMLESAVLKDPLLKPYFTKEKITSGEFGAKSKEIGDVLELTSNLKKGDVTQVVDENACLYFIQCIDRVNYDYLPFEEVKDNVNKVLRVNQYDKLVTSRATQLKVDGDLEKVYDFTRNEVK